MGVVFVPSRKRRGTAPRSAPPVLGAIRGVLLGEREDKKRGPGPHLLLEEKEEGTGAGRLRWGGERSSYLSEKRCRKAGATGYLIGHQDKSFQQRKQAAGSVWRLECGGGQGQLGGGTVSERASSGTRRTMTHFTSGSLS